MFGMMEAMLSFLRRQVGLRTDAADPAGSLHAKAKDVKNVVSTINTNLTRFNPKGIKAASVEVRGSGSGITSTLFDVSGTGRLYELAFVRTTTNTTANDITITITVDGVVINLFSQKVDNTHNGVVFHFPLGYHFLNSCKAEITATYPGIGTVGIFRGTYYI